MESVTGPAVEKGIEHLQQGRLDEAIERFRWVLQWDENNFSAHHFLGAALALKGQTDEAIQHLQKALQINPQAHQTRYNLGQLYQRVGNLHGAMEEFSEALRLNPNYEQARTALQQVQAQLGTAAPPSPQPQEMAPLPAAPAPTPARAAAAASTCAYHPNVPSTSFCQICGKPICPDCERFVKGVLMCFQCEEKQRTGQTVPAALGVPRPSAVALEEKVGFGTRWVAFVIDQLVLFIPSLILGFIPFGGCLTLPLVALYSILLIGSAGQTLGMRAMQIRVVNTDGSAVDYTKAFLRWLASLVSSLVCALGYLWIAFDADKQSWHDKMVSTYVVGRQASTTAIVLATVGFILLNVATFAIFMAL